MARSSKILAAALVTAIPCTALAEGAQGFRGEYSVTFLGLSVAKATFNSQYAADSYKIEGSVSSAGLAQLFDDTQGTLTASGKMVGNKLQPGLFRADYTSGKKASMVDIRFVDGNVVSTTVVPPPKKRGKDWLPLGLGDLKGITDPIAATVLHAGSLDEVCGRTVKMYDGEMRVNLKLDFDSKGSISVKGYEGPTVTCRMNFEPVSGYRTSRKALKFLRDRSRIMVTFAPLGQTGVYAPIYATAGTEIGTITVKARRFEAVD